MIVPFTAFYISLIALGVLFAYKSRALKTGRAERAMPHQHLNLTLPQIDMDAVRKKAMHQTKRYTLFTALLVSKLWLIAVHRMREVLERKYPRFAAIFWRKEGESSESNSVFLRAITEYKLKMKHFKKRLKEQDKEDEE